MASIRDLVRVTVRNEEDPTLEAVTYAMKNYTTDNGWMSIIPFYRVKYRLFDDGEEELISRELINPEHKSRCIRKNKRLPWVYHDQVNGHIIRWQVLNSARCDDDTYAYNEMRTHFILRFKFDNHPDVEMSIQDWWRFKDYKGEDCVKSSTMDNDGNQYNLYIKPYFGFP